MSRDLKAHPMGFFGDRPDNFNRHTEMGFSIINAHLD